MKLLEIDLRGLFLYGVMMEIIAGLTSFIVLATLALVIPSMVIKRRDHGSE